MWRCADGLNTRSKAEKEATMHRYTPLLRQRRTVILLMLLGLLALLAPTAPLHAAGVIYVVPGGAGAQTGTDWASAKDLQAALQSATNGDQIWVKAGIYTPTTGADRSATFQLKSGVALYGGFAGTEASLDQRDPAANMSILSGDLLGNDSGAVASGNATRSENSYHVVTGSGTDDTAILDGFTISSGNANGNIALRETLGGGIFSFQGSPRLCHIIVRRSSAEFGGGGIAYDEGSASICHATIIDNTAGDSGGGIFTRNGTNVVIYRTSLIGNRAQFGGGMENGSAATIVSSSFLSNTATLVGGGILNESSSSTIVQSIFSGNSSGTYGSAMANYQSNPTISQVTFSANWSKNNGGALTNQESSPLIRNSIFWGNQGGQIHNYSVGNAPNVQYSLIQGGYITGTHILDADPLFVDADGADNITGTLDDDLRPQAGSPAIDAGNNAFIPSDLTDDNHNNDVNETAPFDLDSNPRLDGAIVDLGPYEVQLHIHITSALPPAGTYGSSYSHTFTTTAVLPVTYSVSAGSLPPGLALNATTGLLSGIPTAAGSYSGITITVSNADGSANQTFAIQIHPAALTITTNDKIRKFGVPNPPLTASYSGFVHADTPASLDVQVILTTTATITSPPGSYPITASGAADVNYDITFIPATLTIISGRTYLALVNR
jgi:hypothetical protein